MGFTELCNILNLVKSIKKNSLWLIIRTLILFYPLIHLKGFSESFYLVLTMIAKMINFSNSILFKHKQK